MSFLNFSFAKKLEYDILVWKYQNAGDRIEGRMGSCRKTEASPLKIKGNMCSG